MNFKKFSELREFIRRYNSTSVIEIGSKECWQIFEIPSTNHLDWVRKNTKRNYAIRLMLLASAENPHQNRYITAQEFIDLINIYDSLDVHAISDLNDRDQEAESISACLQSWEGRNIKDVGKWRLKLSDVLDLKRIRENIIGLFIQRKGSFQNAGFGYPIARVYRTIKLLTLLGKHLNRKTEDIFLSSTGLNTVNYFRQFLGCIGVFSKTKSKGLCNFLHFPEIEQSVQATGITPENIKKFISQNSLPLCLDTSDSFRGKVKQALNNIAEVHQPFFYNQLLETPFIRLSNEEYCLPDPFSFTESCWNQIGKIVFSNENHKRVGNWLSDSFEDYLENTLFPVIASNCFEKIPESNIEKRADFLISLPNSYIVVECKNALMSADTSAYLDPEGVTEMWCRIHGAAEQIASTVKALNLIDKPVIPLIITFHDSIATSSVFEEMIKNTNYLDSLGFNMPPIVRSLHELEHQLSNRSLNNWAELVLQKQNASSPPPDDKGHNYSHLNDISII